MTFLFGELKEIKKIREDKDNSCIVCFLLGKIKEKRYYLRQNHLSLSSLIFFNFFIFSLNLTAYFFTFTVRKQR